MKTEGIWLLLCGALAVGEGLGFLFAAFAPLWPLAAGLAVVVALFGYGYRVRGWAYGTLFCAGLAVALAALAQRHTLEDTLFHHATGKPVTLSGRLASVSLPRVSQEGLSWYSTVLSVAGSPVRATFPLATAEPPPQPGERWQLTGWTSPAKDVHALPRFWVKGEQTSAQRLPPDFVSRVEAVRQSLRADLLRRAGLGLTNDPLAAALNRAILLGERAALDPAVKADFVNAGTIHIFSISGLHVMFVAHVLLILLLCCAIPYRWIGVALIPILWLYTWIIDMPPSAVRATLMATLYYCAPFVWRQSNTLIAWSLTFLLVHLVDPLRLLQVGNLLSFTVMLGIAVWLAWGPRFASRGWNGFCVTLVAWAAGVPIAACTFARLTIGGLAANFVLIPVAEVSVISGVIGCFVSFVCEPLAIYINHLAGLCTRLMAYVSSCVASVPGSSVEIAPWSWFMCALWYVALGLAIWLVRRLAKTDKFLYAIRKPLEGDKQS